MGCLLMRYNVTRLLLKNVFSVAIYHEYMVDLDSCKNFDMQRKVLKL